MRLTFVFLMIPCAIIASSAGGQSGVGQGQSALTWIPATSYTNGQAMQTGEQRLFVARTFEAACNTSPPTVFDPLATVGAGIANFTHSGLYNGTYYYTSVAVDIFGNASVNSNVACKRVSLSGNWEPPPVGVVPNPPTNLVVQ